MGISHGLSSSCWQNVCQQYPKGNDLTLVSYTNVDWVGNIDDRKSTSGGAFYLGDFLVSWLSKKQYSVSLPTT